MIAGEREVLRRIGVVGDIHGESEFLEATLTFLETADVDLVLSVGDIVDGGGDVDRCCKLLIESGVATVRGNHDRWLFEAAIRDWPDATQQTELSPQARSFLASLPKTRVFKTAAGRMLLCHGLAEYDMGCVHPCDTDYELENNIEFHVLIGSGVFNFVVNGHTHCRMVRTFDHLTLVNAGTLLRGFQPCLLIIDFEARSGQFYDLQDGLPPLERPEFKLGASTQ